MAPHVGLQRIDDAAIVDPPDAALPLVAPALSIASTSISIKREGAFGIPKACSPIGEEVMPKRTSGP